MRYKKGLNGSLWENKKWVKILKRNRLTVWNISTIIWKQLVPFLRGFQWRPWFHASARNNPSLEALNPSPESPVLQTYLSMQVVSSASSLPQDGCSDQKITLQYFELYISLSHYIVSLVKSLFKIIASSHIVI